MLVIGSRLALLVNHVIDEFVSLIVRIFRNRTCRNLIILYVNKSRKEEKVILIDLASTDSRCLILCNKNNYRIIIIYIE